jgi:diguanylate cyclase (GGDEF)-like protein
MGGGHAGRDPKTATFHEAPSKQTPMSIPVLSGRRHRPFLAKLLVACVAVVGLTTLALLVEPAARIAVTFVAALSLVGVMAWSRSRTAPAAMELDRLVTMSTDLSRAVDAATVGDLMARHLALASGVDQSGVCYWDSETGEVLTLGYYPAERRSPVGVTYRLADYPECQRALDDQVVVVLDAADPRLPQNEREYLATIGGSVLAVIPLIANGRSIGLVELTSERPTVLDADRLRVARSMSHMAAMLLENARLLDQLRQQALHDSLTGLANRALFRDRLAHALQRNERTPGNRCAVLFLDLDDFKHVNDAQGHAVGDALLGIIAERLRGSLRPSDTAARLGGDEFAVLVEDVTGVEEVEAVADRIVAAIARPAVIGGREVRVRVSLGVATSPEGGRSVDDLLTNADAAMYVAKAAGKGRSAVYEPGMRVGSVERQAHAPEGLVLKVRRESA